MEHEETEALVARCLAVAAEETEEALGLSERRRNGAPSRVSLDAMLALLREDTLGLESEDSVWDAVVLWARYVSLSVALTVTRPSLCEGGERVVLCRSSCGVVSPDPLEWTEDEKEAVREAIAPLLELVHFPAMDPLQ